MNAAKITITIDERVLARLDMLVAAGVFQDHNQAVQSAVEEKLLLLNKDRLARECGKLEPAEEQAMAEEGMASEINLWPAY
jgi:hypothetical protein